MHSKLINHSLAYVIPEIPLSKIIGHSGPIFVRAAEKENFKISLLQVFFWI